MLFQTVEVNDTNPTYIVAHERYFSFCKWRDMRTRQPVRVRVLYVLYTREMNKDESRKK